MIMRLSETTLEKLNELLIKNCGFTLSERQSEKFPETYYYVAEYPETKYTIVTAVNLKESFNELIDSYLKLLSITNMKCSASNNSPVVCFFETDYAKRKRICEEFGFDISKFEEGEQ